MLRLSGLLGYAAVVIQCHNTLDVDSIASGFALLRWFEANGRPAQLVYGGFAEVTKPNIAEFVRLLDVPLLAVVEPYLGSSATWEVMANELGAFLTEGHGSGGGNREKAGGFMRPPLSGTLRGADAMAMLQARLDAYFQSYDRVVAGEWAPDFEHMRLYRKKPVPVGFVVLTDVFPEGAPVLVRTPSTAGCSKSGTGCWTSPSPRPPTST